MMDEDDYDPICPHILVQYLEIMSICTIATCFLKHQQELHILRENT